MGKAKAYKQVRYVNELNETISLTNQKIVSQVICLLPNVAT